MSNTFDGVAITVFSPKPAILPFSASTVFLIFDIALFSSITSFDFRVLMSMIAIVYPSRSAFRIGFMSSYIFRTNVLISIFDSDFSCSRSISMKSGE